MAWHEEEGSEGEVMMTFDEIDVSGRLKPAS